MFRNSVTIREAVPEDASALCQVWAPSDRPGADGESACEDAGAAVARAAVDPDQRLLVGMLDGQVAGAVHLTRSSLSPVHAEPTVMVNHLQVLEEFRRHGVGHALLEAAVSWAEEKDTGYIFAAASANSRDANRFMARLGLGQVAVVRAAPVAALRAKLPVEPPVAAGVDPRRTRNVGQVLARRRSQRRAKARTS